jgi:phosphatidylglycerophosphate synthase
MSGKPAAPQDSPAPLPRQPAAWADAQAASQPAPPGSGVGQLDKRQDIDIRVSDAAAYIYMMYNYAILIMNGGFMNGDLRLLPVTGSLFPMNASFFTKMSVIVTLMRIPIGTLAAVLVFASHWYLAAVCIFLFFVLDVLDGRFAVLGNSSDTAERRMADALIDKTSVHLCAFGVCLALPETIWVWLILLSRDAIQGIMSYAILKSKNLVAAGAWWHRLFSLFVMVWGCSILVSGAVSIALSLAVIFVGLITLSDYLLKGYRILVGQASLFFKRQ